VQPGGWRGQGWKQHRADPETTRSSQRKPRLAGTQSSNDGRSVSTNRRRGGRWRERCCQHFSSTPFPPRPLPARAHSQQRHLGTPVDFVVPCVTLEHPMTSTRVLGDRELSRFSNITPLARAAATKLIYLPVPPHWPLIFFSFPSSEQHTTLPQPSSSTTTKHLKPTAPSTHSTSPAPIVHLPPTRLDRLVQAPSLSLLILSNAAVHLLSPSQK
jgi:hypothetical protein